MSEPLGNEAGQLRSIESVRAEQGLPEQGLPVEGRLGLPAHRFGPDPDAEAAVQATIVRELVEDRKKKGKKGKVITFDFDETITKCPKQMAHIAKALKKAGDEIWVVTGNESKRSDLINQLNEFKFPFDGLIQYHDDETDGVQRKEVLKELGAWLAFDDRAGRAPVLVKACPHLFLSAKPTKDNVKNAEDAKSAKKIVDDAEDEPIT